MRTVQQKTTTREVKHNREKKPKLPIEKKQGKIFQQIPAAEKSVTGIRLGECRPQ